MDYINKLRVREDEKKILKDYDNLIKRHLKEELYLHSVNTLKYAAMLAQYHKTSQEDYYRICIASILHDYAKRYDLERQRAIIIKNKKKLKISAGDLKIDALLHGFSGSFIISEELGINDKKIIEAIRYHTTGRAKMNMVDKIVYISDKIENGRSYDFIEYLRELSLKNINLCLLEVYKNNIIYIIKQNKSLYSQTLNIWNNICRLYGGF